MDELCVRKNFGRRKKEVESKGFWRWCITLRITGLVDSPRPVKG
jgi:hypothetical protein